MANTADTLGDAATLAALVSDTLTEFEDDRIVTVGNYGLAYKAALTRVTLPSCTEINADAFYGDTGLTTLGLPEVTRVKSRAFYGCTSLVAVTLPKCTSVSEYAFRDCSNLETVRVKSFNSGSNIFTNSSKIKHIVIDATTMESYRGFVPLSIAIGEGALYVQANLVDSYKASSTWNNLVILPLSAYPASSFDTISDTWTEIIAASANGTYATKYHVGDTKTMTIDGVDHKFVLAAMDADQLASDTTQAAPMTWLSHKRIYASHRMNATNTTTGGWASSEMRTWLNDTVLPLFPQEVQSAIKTVRKYSDGFESGAIVHDQTSDDKLWIPSAREVFNGNASYETQGPIYTIFGTASPSSSSDVRMKYGATGSSTTYWQLRSAFSATNFRSVGSGGNVNDSSANYAGGVALGFCI